MTTHERPLSAAGDAYLAAVGAALAGVPDSDRQELLDDLAEHLAELAHESDAGLIERLGPPEQYAAELLASAGIELGRAKPAWQRSQVVERVRAATARFDSAGTRRLQAFLADLRPGWWVARGWLVVAAIAARHGLQEALWLPNVTHNDVQNVVLLAGAVALSVWVGRGPKWAAWIATAIGIVALVSVGTADRSYFYQVNDQSYYPSQGMLTDPNGRVIENIFAYDASGKPIRGVFLVDQNGVPIDIGNASTLQENGVPFISGQFPQPTLIMSSAGLLRGVQPKPPPFAAPRLIQPPTTVATPKTTKPNATATTSPTTGPTTSPIAGATG